jgi:hypothetical protein
MICDGPYPGYYQKSTVKQPHQESLQTQSIKSVGRHRRRWKFSAPHLNKHTPTVKERERDNTLKETGYFVSLFCFLLFLNKKVTHGERERESESSSYTDGQLCDGPHLLNVCQV